MKHEWRCEFTGWHSLTGEECWDADPVLGCYAREILRLAEENRRLREIVAPLLPLFRERAEAWERRQARAEKMFRIGDTTTLTAEFPVSALRALIKE